MSWDLTTPNKGAVSGVPGVIEFCVYPTVSPNFGDTSTVTSESTSAVGAGGGAWSAELNCGPSTCVHSIRPDGNPENIPDNGGTTSNVLGVMFSSAPDAVFVVLHINDASECTTLFGVTESTCFVLPTTGCTTCVFGNPPTVTKDATPSFTRTFTWGIDKSVDNNNVLTAGGAAFTASYTVTVTHDSGSDSDWQVNGQISVVNPNSDTMTVTVSDAVDNGGTCVVAGTFPDTVAPGATKLVLLHLHIRI